MKYLLSLVMCFILNLQTAFAADLLEKQPYDVVLGNEAAAVTVIEYFSLSCPHCADFSKNIFPTINKKYVETGKIRFMARPYAADSSGLLGSTLLQCVPKEKYYVFLKVMLAMQDKWAFSSDPKSNLRTISSVGGFGDKDFDACLADKTKEDLVLRIRKEADEQLKIKALPTFFVGGEELKGAGKLEQFEEIIDKKLK